LEKQRITSIDIFRGLTMMLMTIVNNPGDWGNVYAPLLHAEWHGATPTDMVFPFFVFIMGTAMPFSTLRTGVITKDYFLKILTRSLRIFNLGLFLNFFSKIQVGELEGAPLVLIRLIIAVGLAYAMLGNFKANIKLGLAIGATALMLILAFWGGEDFASVRIPGVLQRIALVYFFAALIYQRFDLKGQLIAGALLLISYWAMMALIPVPGGIAPNFDKGTNLAAWIDNTLLPGHLWASSKTWDPEGILSTIPTITTVLLGIWTGNIIQNQKSESYKWLLGIGLALIITGKLWGVVFPINKALWTSSYVLFAGGWAMLVLAIVSVIDEKAGNNPVTRFLIVWGVNPMIVFFGSGILPRALGMVKISHGEESLGTLDYINEAIIKPLFANPMNASLAFAIFYVILWSIILLILDRKKLIFKV
jgi:predicted acyltransferase